MKKYGNGVLLVISMAVVSFVSGCAYSAKIIDKSEVYSMPMIQSAPKIILADMTDSRADKKMVGRVGALDLTSQTAINVVLTNRIASKLREEGFNVQKMNLSKPMDRGEIAEALKSNSGKAFLSGGLDNFFIASFDAVMEKAKGTTTFYVKVFDKEGNAIFNKNYLGYAENWIGLTGQFGCEKLIEQCIQASVDELFKDPEVKSLLEKIRRQ
jgi:hypothetical protein